MRHKRLWGVTLIELMIVVVIVGILAAVAYPSYTRYMAQSRRSDGQIALVKVASAEEKYFTDCNSYAGTLEGVRQPPPNNCLGILGYRPAAPILSDSQNYVLTIVASTASCPITGCFVLQATPATTAQGGTGQQTGNGNLRLGSDGTKTWAKNGVSYVNKWTDK
jgi:type IV pilus assembly protein PilE